MEALAETLGQGPQPIDPAGGPDNAASPPDQSHGNRLADAAAGAGHQGDRSVLDVCFLRHVAPPFSMIGPSDLGFRECTP